LPNLYTLKDHFKESQLYLNRTIAATVLVLILLGVLIGRLVFLQIYQHDLYQTLSLNNQVRIVPITPPRGLIFDRNGTLLAENAPAFSLELTAERVPNIEETLAAIHTIIPFTEAEEKQFYKQLKIKRRNEGIPIRVKLSEEEVAKFSIEKYRFPGVDVVARLIRHYPLGPEVAHPLGYIGPISEKELSDIDPANYRGTYYIGKTSVEKFYETELHGKTGYQHIETDAKGRPIRVLNRIPPKPGANLYLSLDIKLQKAASEAFQEYKGAIVAIDPKTGGILAMVSHPSFDPNHFTQGIDANTYRDLQDSPQRPLFNRAIRGQYAPGSTVKPLVALQALDIGSISPQFRIFDPGWYQLNGTGRLYRDWIWFSKKRGHGTVDLEKAIVQSCDTYFFTIANRIGIRNLHDIFTRFGMGSRTNIDMTGESPGLVPSSEWKKRVYNQAWYPGDTLNIGIGQGTLLATPLQMAYVAATLANRGKRITPRIVAAIDRDHTGTPETLPPKEIEPVSLKSDIHWDTVLDAMHKVVTSGTAARINPGLKYTVAGKTGTAQVFNLKQNEKYEVHKVKVHLRDHSWFIGFAPVDDPQIAIAVIIENYDKTKPGSVIARTVLDEFFNLKAIAENGNPKTESENLTNVQKGTSTPETHDDEEEDDVGGAEQDEAHETHETHDTHDMHETDHKNPNNPNTSTGTSTDTHSKNTTAQPHTNEETDSETEDTD
jgi:penicillin-binding protein 2